MDNEIVNNTDVSIQDVAKTDNSNSEADLQKQISDVLIEPENTENTTEVKQEENQEPQKENNINCPDKFKNQDGTINIETVLKSYN